MNEQLQRLASGIPLEGWEAIKSVPGVLDTVTAAAGIVVERTSDLDAMCELLYAPPEPSLAAIFVLSALCLTDELRGRALSGLSAVCRGFAGTCSADTLFQFVNCAVFARRSDGLNFVLTARLFSLTQDAVRGNVQFVLDGLNCPDATARKQSLFILKQLVAKAEPGEGSVLYCSSPDWQDSWAAFILLYETFQEPQSHLLEPLFPLLRNFMVDDSHHSLGMSWWESIMRRGLENTSVAVRKRLLDHIIMEIPIERHPCLQQAEGFVFGKLLDLVDNSYLYSAIDFGRLVSPFGLSVTRFFVKFFSFARSAEERRARLLKFFGRLDSLRSNMAILFLLNALLEAPPVGDLIQQDQLDVLSRLAEHRGFHNHRARVMLRCQLVGVLVAYCRPQAVGLKPLSHCLHVLVSEVRVSDCNPDTFDQLCAWFCTQDGIEDKVKSALDAFFLTELSCADDIEQLSTLSGPLGLVSAILIRSDAFGQACSERILGHLNRSIAEHDLFLLLKCFLMIVALDESVERFTCGAVPFLHGLATDAKIFSVCSFVDALMLPDVGVATVLDFPMIHPLLTGFRLMLEELQRVGDGAPVVQRMLIEYLDILLIRCAHWVDRLHAASGPAEHQVMKIVVPGVTLLALTALNAVEFPVKCPVDSRFIHQMLDLDLQKPPGGPDDALWQAWPQLVDSQTEYKWSVVREYAKHIALVQTGSDELHGLFDAATALLSTSRFKSTVSIVRCLQELLRIFSGSQADKLASSTQQLADAFRHHLDGVGDERTKWFSVYAVGMIDCLFQPNVAKVPRLHCDPDGPLFAFFVYFLKTVGPARRGLFPYLVVQLYPFLKADAAIRHAYLPLMPEILMYGPVRNIPEERLADAFNR